MNDQPRDSALPADDWLEQALVGHGQEHRAAYLADDGFTARVAAALPAPATLPAWRRPAAALLWTAAAAGVAVALPGAVFEVAGDLVRLVASHPVSLGNIATGVVALGLSTWTAVAVVLRRD